MPEALDTHYPCKKRRVTPTTDLLEESKSVELMYVLEYDKMIH